MLPHVALAGCIDKGTCARLFDVESDNQGTQAKGKEHKERVKEHKQSLKNCISHIDASHSRQPLVKGERLVRYEVNAVMVRKVTKAR